MPAINDFFVVSGLARNRRPLPLGWGSAGRVYGLGKWEGGMLSYGLGDGVPSSGQTERQALASGKPIWETDWGQAVDPVSGVANWVWHATGQYAVGTRPDGTTYPIYGYNDPTFGQGTASGFTPDEMKQLENYYGQPIKAVPMESLPVWQQPYTAPVTTVAPPPPVVPPVTTAPPPPYVPPISSPSLTVSPIVALPGSGAGMDSGGGGLVEGAGGGGGGFQSVVPGTMQEDSGIPWGLLVAGGIAAALLMRKR